MDLLTLGNKVYRKLFTKNYNAKFFPLGKRRRKSPIDAWAFIRAKNEIITLDACLQSILPSINKGVIGYCNSDDGTEEYILQFCKENPDFIPYKHPYDVIPPHSVEYQGDYNPKRGLDYYYTQVLKYIPKDKWLIKIDCDHVYDTEKLKQLMYLPKNDNEYISISRINLHYQNGELYSMKNDLYRNPSDHFLVKKEHVSFKMSMGNKFKHNKQYEFYAYEVFDASHLQKINTNLLTWHFPNLKSWRNNEIPEIIPFDKKHYSDLKDITSDMLDKTRILNLVKKFNID